MQFLRSIAATATIFCAAGLSCAAQADDVSVSGQLRGLWNVTASNPDCPAIRAADWLPGMPASGSSQGKLEGEFHFSGHALSAIFTLQGQGDGAGGTSATGWINELAFSHDLGAWQISLGKKIVAWDVGYGFRPNDVVQQEKRRALIGTTAIGKPLAMLEYFDADNAAALVWVNPASGKEAEQEQALAARIYHRSGGLDLHGYARYGRDSGASLGAAAAWVASDALELHASMRYLRRTAAIGLASGGAVLPRSAWLSTERQNGAVQALFGASFTTGTQHSFLLEAWWDGSAASPAAWRNWSTRNRALQVALATPSPWQTALAGNLAGQSGALTASASLQRLNLYARWSWQSGAWQPALDVLLTPAERGRIVTAALGWQGDQWRIDGGLRAYGGPAAAVLAQLPDAKTAYVAASWAF